MLAEKSLVIPFPSAWHGDFLDAAAKGAGLPWAFFSTVDSCAVRRVLSTVNNDICYTTIAALAQVAHELPIWREGGEEDCLPESGDTCLWVPRFCPGCRSSYAPSVIVRALPEEMRRSVGLCDIAAVLNSVSADVQRRLAHALVAADVLFQLQLRIVPHVRKEQAAYFDAFEESWRARVMERLRGGSDLDACELGMRLDEEAMRIVHLCQEAKPQVGVIGDAASLYCPAMNGNMVHVVENEGCEVVMPNLASLVSYSLHVQGVGCVFLDEIDALLVRLPERFHPVEHAVTYEQIKRAGTRFVPERYCRGLGWFFAGWASLCLESGITNLVYARPFGCLPGHVAGSGVLRRLRQFGQGANIVSIEFDPGVSEVNQLNRIKLMAAIARGEVG